MAERRFAQYISRTKQSHSDSELLRALCEDVIAPGLIQVLRAIPCQSAWTSGAVRGGAAPLAALA